MQSEVLATVWQRQGSVEAPPAYHAGGRGFEPGPRRRTSRAGQLVRSRRPSLDTYWGHDKNAKHRAGVLSRLEADVFPGIGALSFESVTAQHLVVCALRIEERGAHEYAKRCLQTAAQIGRFAVARGIAARNAAADIRPSNVLRPMKKANHARIDAKEPPELLRRIDAYDGSPLTRGALQLMALTFVRTAELIGALGRV